MDGTIAHANQLPLPKLYSAAGHESDSCKWRYSKCHTFTFTFTLIADSILLAANLKTSVPKRPVLRHAFSTGQSLLRDDND